MDFPLTWPSVLYGKQHVIPIPMGTRLGRRLPASEREPKPPSSPHQTPSPKAKGKGHPHSTVLPKPALCGWGRAGLGGSTQQGAACGAGGEAGRVLTQVQRCRRTWRRMALTESSGSRLLQKLSTWLVSPPTSCLVPAQPCPPGALGFGEGKLGSPKEEQCSLVEGRRSESAPGRRAEAPHTSSTTGCEKPQSSVCRGQGLGSLEGSRSCSSEEG